MAGRCGCSSSCSCVAESSDSVEVSGVGQVGAPWVPEVLYSTDAGNRARAGTDGAVYADTCLSDPAGDPIEPDEDGCLQVPPPVILDYNSDPIPPGPDGSIQLPPGGEAPPVGCGISVDGEGAVSVDVSGTWPPLDLYGNAVAGTVAEGAPIFCGPDGVVTGPDHTTLALQSEESQVVPSPEEVDGGDTFTSGTGGPYLIENPSDSRKLLGRVTTFALVDLETAAGFPTYVQLQVQQDGGAWSTMRTRTPTYSTVGGVEAGSLRQDVEIHVPILVEIPPGGDLELNLRALVVTDASGSATVHAVRLAAGFDGGTV